MSVIPSVLNGGTNTYQTPPEAFMPYIGDLLTDGCIQSGDLAVTAQGSPNMTVAVAGGAALITATPTSEIARRFRTTLSASTNVTINANTSGSTRYDLVYLSLAAATLHTPPTSGDFTEGATLSTSRQTTSGVTLSGAGISNAILLAEVLVANNAASITSGNITEKRIFTDLISPTGRSWLSWTPTCTGFSSAPSTGSCRYQQRGKDLIINSLISGTSNATTFTFTSPVTIRTSQNMAGIYINDNGTSTLNGLCVPTGGGSNLITVYTSASGGGWTASGSKGVNATLILEAY